MRIAYLSNSVIPSRYANAVHVMRMCDAFAGLGHEVELACVSGGPETDEEVLKHYGIENGFKLRRYSWNSLWARSRLGDFRIALGSRCYRPDLVFSRSISACYFAVRLGLPVILEMHNPPHVEPFTERAMLRGIARMKTARGLVVISQALKSLFIKELGTLSIPLIVAHDAANPLPVGVVEPLGPPDRLQAVYVGQLYQGRGIELLAELAHRAPWIDFHIVGGMEDAIALWRQRCADITNFHLHGFVPPSETHRFVRGADVLLAPYQSQVSILNRGDTSQWMSPLKVFEYMAAGRAIIISDIAVLREVLENEKTALMVPPDNVSAWLEALRRLKDNSDIRLTLGQAALAEFRRAHTWQTRARSILEQLA